MPLRQCLVSPASRSTPFNTDIAGHCLAQGSRDGKPGLRLELFSTASTPFAATRSRSIPAPTPVERTLPIFRRSQSGKSVKMRSSIARRMWSVARRGGMLCPGAGGVAAQKHARAFKRPIRSGEQACRKRPTHLHRRGFLKTALSAGAAAVMAPTDHPQLRLGPRRRRGPQRTDRASAASASATAAPTTWAASWNRRTSNSWPSAT